MTSDEALFEQVVRGDLGAFDVLYARHERHLFGFLRAHLRDAAEAEDVLHEVFLAVLKQRGQATATQSFKAWLFSVARHACLNRLRTKRRADGALARVDEVPAPASAPERLEAHQAVRALEAAVAQLPTNLRELYHLRAKGLSYAQLAEVLAVPMGTVKSRLHELVQRLKAEVAS